MCPHVIETVCFTTNEFESAVATLKNVLINKFPPSHNTRKEDIEDAAGEGTISWWKDAPAEVRMSKGRSFNWMRTVATRCLIRLNARGKEMPCEPLPEDGEADARFGCAPPMTEGVKEIYDLIYATFPKEDADILCMRYFESMTLKEISEMTGSKLAFVKTRFYRARPALLELLIREGYHTPISTNAKHSCPVAHEKKSANDETEEEQNSEEPAEEPADESADEQTANESEVRSLDDSYTTYDEANPDYSYYNDSPDDGVDDDGEDDLQNDEAFEGDTDDYDPE